MAVPTTFQYKKIKLTSRGPGKKIFYKYCLLQDVCVGTKITLNAPLTVPGYIDLSTQGLLKINEGYSWNGASGIPDTEANMLAALVHDALYQLMREYNCNAAPGTTTIGGISRKVFRLEADILFRIHYKNNGGWRWWITIVFYMLRKFGKYSTLCGGGSDKKKGKQLGPDKTAPALGLTSCPNPNKSIPSS